MPTAGPVRVDIGTVLPGEEQTDFSARPAVGTGPAGGAVLARRDVRRRPISPASGSSAPTTAAGSAVTVTATDRSAGLISRSSLADITAYPSGISTDGFGFGGVRLRRVRVGGVDLHLDLRTAALRQLVLCGRAVRLGRQSGDAGDDLGPITAPPAPPGLNDDNWG